MTVQLAVNRGFSMRRSYDRAFWWIEFGRTVVAKRKTQREALSALIALARMMAR